MPTDHSFPDRWADAVREVVQEVIMAQHKVLADQLTTTLADVVRESMSSSIAAGPYGVDTSRSASGAYTQMQRPHVDPRPSLPMREAPSLAMRNSEKGLKRLQENLADNILQAASILSETELHDDTDDEMEGYGRRGSENPHKRFSNRRTSDALPVFSLIFGKGRNSASACSADTGPSGCDRIVPIDSLRAIPDVEEECDSAKPAEDAARSATAPSLPMRLSTSSLQTCSSPSTGGGDYVHAVKSGDYSWTPPESKASRGSIFSINCGPPPCKTSSSKLWKRKGAGSTASNLRKNREWELTRYLQKQMGDNSADTPNFARHVSGTTKRLRRWEPVPFALGLCGAIPWKHQTPRQQCCSVWYQRAIFGLAVLGFTACVYHTATVPMANPSEPTFQDFNLLSDVPIALGCLVSLFCLQVQVHGGNSHVRTSFLMLCAYAQRQEFQDQLVQASWWDTLATCALWLAAVAMRLKGSGFCAAVVEGRLDPWGLAALAAFMFASFVLLALTLAVIYIVRALLMMVDRFCYQVARDLDLSAAVREWNVIQALLRKICGTIENCFFAMQTTILCTVLLGVMDLARLDQGDILALIPTALVMLGVVRIFCASAVTGKCAHVPALINSLSFGQEIDTERQYVVEYITNSAAGFYVYEVRLTSALALKVGYVCAAMGFMLVNRVLSNDFSP